MTSTVFLAWALMLSQAIESVTRVFYARADLDLIMSSPAKLRQRLFGAHRRDRADRHRDGALAVDALCRRAGARRRRQMVFGFRRRHRGRPVGSGIRNRHHHRAVSPDRSGADAADRADSRGGHRRGLCDRAADRSDPVLRHTVAFCGSDLRRGGRLCARRRQHVVVAGAALLGDTEALLLSVVDEPRAARRRDGDLLAALRRHRDQRVGPCRLQPAEAMGQGRSAAARANRRCGARSFCCSAATPGWCRRR